MTAGGIGRALPRFEDADLVVGRARYVSNLAVPDGLEAVFVRSVHPHGVLRGVDLSGARAAPGVVGAWAAADLDDLPAIPVPEGSGMPVAMARPSLARDRVRFVGEPVAVVAAEDVASAEDAAELVLPDVEPLSAVVDPRAAARPDAVRLFEGTVNVVTVEEFGAPAGAVEAALAAAPVRVELDIHHTRLSHVSLEARAVLAVPGDGESITVWCSHQAPHRLHAALVERFGLDPGRLRVVSPDVGGAFGGKSQTYPEYLVAVHLARMLRRPVRWVESRSEAFVAATHGRGQRQRVRLGADRDGRVRALAVEIDGDAGAYPHTSAPIPALTAWMISGPYRFSALRALVRTAVTNATPTSAYRGAGRPEAAFALERAMDELARRVGLDPAEVRRRNFIAPDAFPYRSPTGAVYDSGNHEAALDLALELAGYPDIRAEQRRRRDRDDPSLLGVGIASYVERSGGNPGSSEYGAVEVREDGTIVARAGSSSQGQGHRTAFAQIVASVLGMEPSDIEVVEGDTGAVPTGTGTFASRSIQVAGSALHEAARAVVEEGRRRASELFGVRVRDTVYRAGEVAVASSPDRRLRLTDVAARTGPLAAEREFVSPQAFPFGTYVAVVEVDAETGQVRLVRIVAVDDCGTLVNPLLVEGQVVGSIAQGIGQALYEGIRYDEAGRPHGAVMTDYGVPSATETADVVVAHTTTPNPSSPLGAKGAGEAGCIGAPPAIVNAVVDALEGHDATSLGMPVTPQKVWELLRRGRGAVAPAGAAR